MLELVCCSYLYLIKMEKITINVIHDTDVFFPAVAEDRKNIESNCNEITFVNKTDGDVQVNNFTLSSGDSLIYGGNSFEMIKTKFQIVNLTATTGAFYALRKRYL